MINDFQELAENSSLEKKYTLVIRDFIGYISEQHIIFYRILNINEIEIISSIGVINRLDKVNQKYYNSENKRHFTKTDEILFSKDFIEFVVCNQWGNSINIDNILKLAKNLGYKIETIDS